MIKKIHNAKELPCTVCGTHSATEQGFFDISLYRCPSCDHCFSNLNPALHEYNLEYFDVLHRNWFNNPNIKLFETIRELISNYKIDASIIDIGCGNGDFLKYIHQKNSALNLTGIDFTPNTSVEGIEFLQGDILTLNLKRQYDVVVSIGVFEHVSNVRLLVKKVYDLCSQGGLVIITTINDRGILYAAARLLYKIGYRTAKKRLYSKHHVNHFNVSSINRLVENSGLSSKKIFLHNMPLKAVDISAQSPITSSILRFGVWATFILGRLTGRTFLQTVICQKEGLSSKQALSHN